MESSAQPLLNHGRSYWSSPQGELRLIAASALLTALQGRGAHAAARPLARAFARRLSQRSGQQLCCNHAQLPAPSRVAQSFHATPPSSCCSSAGTSSSSSPSAFRALHRPPAAAAQTPGHSSGPPLPHPVQPTSHANRPSGSTPPSTTTTPTPTRRTTPCSPTAAAPALAGPIPGPGPGHSTSLLRSRLPSSYPTHRTNLSHSNPFRSFASSACHPHPPASPAPAFSTAVRYARSQLTASTTYVSSVRQSVGRSLLAALEPYWGSMSWEATVSLLTRQAACWLPSLPAAGMPSAGRQLHFFLLNALNALGQHLPVTLALTVAELARSSRTSHADAFRYHLEVTSGGDPLEGLPWWRAAPLRLAHLATSVLRTLWLLLLFGPVLLTAPVALQLNLARAEWIEMLRKTLEAAGPAFIKWGQWAATRHDLFPPDMCEELERLHTQAPGHKFKHTQRAIEEAFGLPLHELFSEIDQQPVASGSIGQIHRAVLTEKGAAMTGVPAGSTVAVKVRHPGVGAAILRDFATMMAVAHVASMLPSLAHLRLEQTLSQFAAPLREQVDLSREASNLRRFNHNFRKTRHVFFPVPLYPLVTPDVLVESFESGEHITAYIQSDNNPYNHRLSELGSGTMLQMMLVDNLIHSDLHPGNILVRLDPPGGLLGLVYRGLDQLRESSYVAPPNRARIELLQQRWLQPSLVLLDVGMATELSPTDQTNMVGLFRSFAAMDGRACGDWTLRFSGASQSCPDPEAFREAMEATFDELRKSDQPGGWESSTFKNGADALAAVLELVRLHQVSLPGHICAVVVTTLVLEGWSNKLDPDHSVLSQVQAMFEPENVPWGARMTQLVDRVMEEEANHFALA